MESIGLLFKEGNKYSEITYHNVVLFDEVKGYGKSFAVCQINNYNRQLHLWQDMSSFMAFGQAPDVRISYGVLLSVVHIKAPMKDFYGIFKYRSSSYSDVTETSYEDVLYRGVQYDNAIVNKVYMNIKFMKPGVAINTKLAYKEGDS